MPLPDEATDDEINALVRGMIGSTVLTHHQAADLTPQVFLPVLFGACDRYTDDELRELVVWGDTNRHQTAAMSVNGMPIFFECAIWRRTCFQKAIDRVAAVNTLLLIRNQPVRITYTVPVVAAEAISATVDDTDLTTVLIRHKIPIGLPIPPPQVAQILGLYARFLAASAACAESRDENDARDAFRALETYMDDHIRPLASATLIREQ